MADEKARSVLERFKSASVERRLVESLWEDISDLVAPHRSTRVDDQELSGRDRVLYTYDNTAQTDAKLLAADLHGRSVSSSVPWFALAPSDPALAMDLGHESMLWIDNAQNLLLAIFNSPKTGYMTSTHEIFQDLTSFGTGVRFRHDEGGGNIFYQARPLFETYIHTDHLGRPDTLFRKLLLTARQAVMSFGRENLSDKVIRTFESGKEADTKRFVFIHLIGPRKNRIQSRPDSFNMPFESIVVDQDACRVVKESGFNSSPFSVCRWALSTGNTYGNSPATDSLDEIRMANAIAKSQIEGKSRESNPAYLISDTDVLGSFQNFPGGVTYKRPGSNSAVEMLPTGNSRAGDELLVQTQAEIHRAFMIDKLEIPQNDRMTTTEVIERSMSSIRAFSPHTSRVQMELFTPDIEWTVAKAISKGWLAQPPEQLRSAGGVVVQYVSPLSLTQRLAESQSINLWIQSLIPLANIDPSVLEAIEMDEVPAALARGLNVPARVMKDKQVVIEARQRRLELQNVVNEAAAVQQVAAAAQGTGEATERVANTLSLAG